MPAPFHFPALLQTHRGKSNVLATKGLSRIRWFSVYLPHGLQSLTYVYFQKLAAARAHVTLPYNMDHSGCYRTDHYIIIDSELAASSTNS